MGTLIALMKLRHHLAVYLRACRFVEPSDARSMIDELDTGVRAYINSMKR